MNPSWLQQLLERESTDKFYITYKGYRANHLSHGIVALQRLGATEEEIKPFIRKYTERLVPGEQFRDYDTVKSQDKEDYLGKRTGFYLLRKHYEDMLGAKYPDVKTLLKNELPKLSDGMLGSAYHGVILTGYGFVAGSDKIVCEGLAYSLQSFNAPFTGERNHPSIGDISAFGQGKKSIVDIIVDLKNDKTTYQSMLTKSESPEMVKTTASVFQRRETVLFAEYSDKLFHFADEVKLPDWFDNKSTNVEQAVKLGRWIVQQAVKVYVMSETINDFFLLHGITGAWTMYKILPLLEYKDAVRMCRVFIATFFATYMIQDCPSLTRQPLEFYDGPVNQEAWDLVLKDAKAKSWEVHILKLIQCCYDMRQENPVEEDELEIGRFYLAACYSGMKNHFGRIWGLKRQLRNDGQQSDDEGEETVGEEDVKH